MIIYDFFAGTRSATQAFKDAGHTVITIEIDTTFEANERDILELNAADMIARYGQPDFIWASPPCTTFSVASIGRYWNPDYTPKNDKASDGMKLVEHTVRLITDLNPRYWVIENPRGMLRKLNLVPGNRKTVTYCQYGDTRMKPTDLWTNIEQWQPKPLCKPKAACHEAAPRGSRTGTQGLKGAKVRSMIPYALGQELMEVMTSWAT